MASSPLTPNPEFFEPGSSQHGAAELLARLEAADEKKVDPSLAGMKKPSATFGEAPPVPHASTTLESPTSEVVTDLDELAQLVAHAQHLAYAAKGTSSGATIKIRTAMSGGVKSLTVSW